MPGSDRTRSPRLSREPGVGGSAEAAATPDGRDWPTPQRRWRTPIYAAKQTRPAVVAARERWAAAAPTWDPTHLVFLDECGPLSNLLRPYGRRRRGTRLIDFTPFGAWQTSTLLLALRADGLVAPGVLGGPVDGDSFTAYVVQVLVPTSGRATS